MPLCTDCFVSQWFVIEKKFSVFLPDTMPIGSEDPVEQEDRSQYIIAGIEAIIRIWVTREFQERIDEIVAIVNRAHQQ